MTVRDRLEMIGCSRGIQFIALLWWQSSGVLLVGSSSNTLQQGELWRVKGLGVWPRDWGREGGSVNSGLSGPGPAEGWAGAGAQVQTETCPKPCICLLRQPSYKPITSSLGG